MSALQKKGGPEREARKKTANRRKFPRAFLFAFLLYALLACFYLIRLEAHTRADLFLPVNYHSIASQSGAERSAADSLDVYYEKYVDQPGRPYTLRQDLLLSRLAYIKAPPGFQGVLQNITLADMLSEIETLLADPALDAARLFGRDRQQIADILTGIRQHSVLQRLVLLESIDDPSGLAGYVFEDDGALTFALRGTDGPLDMIDNLLLLPFNLSVQYPPMRGLLARYSDAPRIWLTGHSKGGHNALYAASIDPRCRATGFNAPGFGIFLSDKQHDGLDSGVNYVINGDVTGFLLFHLERRVVLESAGAAEALSSGNRHRMDNFFAPDDLIVSARVDPLSQAFEWATQLLWLLLVFLAGWGLFALLKAVKRGVYGKMLRRR